MAKAKRMALDGVQDHIVLHIAEKNTTKDVELRYEAILGSI